MAGKLSDLVPEIEEALIKQIASLIVAQTPEERIAEQLRITRREVRKILLTDACKVAIKEIGDAAVRVAIQTIRTRTSHLAHLATDVLEKNLAKGDLEAVKLVYRTVGIFEAAEAKPQGDTNLTVVLPGKVEPKDVHATIEGEFRAIDAEAKDE